jgi:acetyl esterase/lipase
MRCERIYLIQNDPEVYIDTYLADPLSSFTRKALLVIPGGGYGQVCADREGEPIAHAFLPYGYNAFVLHYSVKRRMPFPAQLIEAAMAMKHIRDHAKEYGIDPEEIFAVGFSAGAHLAASLGTLWRHPAIRDAIDAPVGAIRPRGVMLIYPVISSDPAIAHKGSFCNLFCTDTPTQEQLDAVSLEKHVDAESSPAYILHTVTDQLVPVENSLVLARAYTEAGVPYELHIFPDAPHGVALGNAITAGTTEKWKNPAIAEWVRMACAWADVLCRQPQ